MYTCVLTQGQVSNIDSVIDLNMLSQYQQVFVWNRPYHSGGYYWDYNLGALVLVQHNHCPNHNMYWNQDFELVSK